MYIEIQNDLSYVLAQVIVDEIVKCSTMTSLRLEGNTVGVEAAEAIAEALAKHPEFQVHLLSFSCDF